MKFEHNPKYTTIAIYALIVLLIAMVCYQAMMNVSKLFGYVDMVVGFLRPIIYGIVFAFLLNPLLRKFDDKLLPGLFGNRLKPVTKRAVSLLCTYIIAIVAVGSFIWLVVPQVLGSLVSIGSKIDFEYLELQYYRFYIQFRDFLSVDSSASNSQLITDLGYALLNSFNDLQGAIGALVEMVIGTLMSLATSLTTAIVNLVLGMIVSIYILLDREKLFAQCKKICYALFPERIYKLLYDICIDVNRIFSGFVIGKVIDSAIIGVLCMIGMSIFGFPYAVLISVIIGVTNVIPYFGPFIGAVPGALLILIESPQQAFFFLIFILLLQQLDGNVIGPKILGDSIGLSPLWIVFSIMLFSGLMGILGMFIGVPLFAILYTLAKRLVAYLLERKGASPNTRDYDTESNPLIK